LTSKEGKDTIMQGAVLSPLASWQNFYAIVGTAAATLTGLMFVAITLIASVRVRMPLSEDGIGAFNTPNVVHFCVALLIAALLSAPWQAFWQVSLLLGLVGLGGMGYIVIVIRRTRRLTAYEPVLEDWLWHLIFPFICYTALIVTAIVIPGNPVLALFIIAGTEMLFLFIGIHNAWDNVTYLILAITQSENKRQDQ
jgi:hypothetical protein